MKFLPTVDLWNPATQYAVRTGQLKLVKGQWVKCGSEKLSRFVCVRPNGVLWVAHPEGKRGTRDSFRRLCEAVGKPASRDLRKVASGTALELPPVTRTNRKRFTLEREAVASFVFDFQLTLAIAACIALLFIITH